MIKAMRWLWQDTDIDETGARTDVVVPAPPAPDYAEVNRQRRAAILAALEGDELVPYWALHERVERLFSRHWGPARFSNAIRELVTAGEIIRLGMWIRRPRP